MPEQVEPTHREAVARAWRAATLAESVMESERPSPRALEYAAVSRAWSLIASQLPVVEHAVEPVTEFIPRVVEPLAVPLCYCPHGHGDGHARGGYCT